MKLKIALLAGDGIGPEISREGVKVMTAVCRRFGHEVEFVSALVGAAAIAPSAIRSLKRHIMYAVMPMPCCSRLSAILGSTTGPT